MKSLCIAVLLTFTVTATTPSQVITNKEGSASQIIERVDIRGHRRIPALDVKSWISTHEGGVYKLKKLDRDLRALYDTGHFENVKVFVEEGLQGGKIVTFEVTDRPLILEIAYEGIDSSQQAEVIGEWSRQRVNISKGSEYDPVRIRRAAKIIQDLLNERGNQGAKVIPYVKQQSATEVLVIFKVRAGDQR